MVPLFFDDITPDLPGESHRENQDHKCKEYYMLKECAARIREFPEYTWDVCHQKNKPDVIEAHIFEQGHGACGDLVFFELMFDPRHDEDDQVRNESPREPDRNQVALRKSNIYQ